MKITTTLSLLCCALSLHLNAAQIEKQQIEFIGPLTSGSTLKPFETPHRNEMVDALAATLSASHEKLILGQKTLKWQSYDSVSALTIEGMQALKYRFSTTRFTEGKFTLVGIEKATVYLNGERQGDSTTQSIALPTGDYELLVVAEQVPDWNKVTLSFEGKADHDVVLPHTSPTHSLSPKQLFDAPTVSAISLSPNGKFYITTERKYSDKTGNKPISVTTLFSANGDVKYRFAGNSAAALSWSPDSKRIAFLSNDELNILDVATLNLNTMPYNLASTSDWQFFDNNSLIFSWSKNTDDNDKITKHYRGLEDRWSYFRENSQIYRLDLESGLITAATKGKLSATLEDFDSERNTILISRQLSDYAAAPHAMTELVEVDLTSDKETMIGQYRTFNEARYGKKGFYVVAGPDFMNGAGRAIPEGQLANNYDGQLYWLSSDGKDVEALSKTFDPSIGGFEVVNKEDLILSVTEEDTKPLFFYDASKNRFTRLKTGLDVTEKFAVTHSSTPDVYVTGSTATSPQQLVKLNVNKNKPETLWDSKPLAYADTAIPQLEEFNFKNQDGIEIKGRVYLPTNLDKTKQYPALVYYYGGTSPVNRGFTGRYPFNYWAAQGYVVYVLQPTGATGFGQAFSSAHVNAWGEKTADDIIQGTQAFLKQYHFVNPKKVGNLGASYGGFMTMLLATKTDLFSASIAHAGISNITSYWGQGWWGYLYSGEASKNSFPWNNPTLYSQHSPVFHADKVNSPLLLIHGDADTNVPPGESHNMYTALKILGKDVELVEFKGANHQIFARDRRFKWWDTMQAYFDKHLKDEPQWWDYLYQGK
ncbi:alpha/beta hydrolase family protein [Pseudoalteromonas xiamenensis]|uniref:S9 family peptidase n=1 Tax=Pseudoalteromonas xiamenensis TaxID=882626 RepID=A0A975HM20_9GAMM|nr:S9 family peptidase [Pseudoalteromonas xiamenensis]QTH72683.1 S9 family peptidase [Pseudoalteromonas xiamenensis]